MFNGIAFSFALLFVLTLIVRRFFSRNRGDLGTYLREHDREVRSRIESMRLETHRFNAHEALAPVAAGLHELLDLHGKPDIITLTREDDALVLRSPDVRIAVIWNFRAAGRPSSTRSKHIYGKGQWELRVGETPPELYAQLDGLMGRLSLLLRGMITHVPHAGDVPDGPTRLVRKPHKTLPPCAANIPIPDGPDTSNMPDTPSDPEHRLHGQGIAPQP